MPEHRLRRRRDYTPTRAGVYAAVDGRPGSGGAGEYLRFLKEEFVPFIEREYRTDPSQRGFWGWSFGAVFGTYAMFHEPNLFSRYILASPAMHWDGGVMFAMERAYAEHHDDLSAAVYLTVGSEETAAVVWWSALRDSLHARGYPGLSLMTAQMEGAGHFSTVPLTFTRGLLALYGKVSIAEELDAIIAEEGTETAVVRYHAARATDPGGYRLGERELNRLGYDLLREDRFEEAIAVFELNVEAFPESANVYDSLGEAYMEAGEREKAVVNYRRSLAIDPGNDHARDVLRRLEAEE